MLSGDNSILSRAGQARTKTVIAQDEETISLAYLAAITGNYTNGEDISSTLKSELEKTYGSENVTVKKDGDTYTVTITGKGIYTIDANGKVEKSGPPVSYANIRIVTNSNGTGENVATGTKTPTTDKLYIYFEASVEGGTTSISPSVPFEISQNGTYNFTITSTVNGETFTTTKSILINQYAVRAGIKIGDYITYTSPTASVTLSKDETGSSEQQILHRMDLFRVLDIDDEGNMNLIGAMNYINEKICIKGAQGYNNAVYVLNKKCNNLYKNDTKGITARSIKEEDITSRFNSTGHKRITEYIDEKIGNVEIPTSNTLTTGTYITAIDKTNKTVTYVNSRARYPNIFQYEAGGLIGTAPTGMLARSSWYDGYGQDEILTSADIEGNPATTIPQTLQSDTTLTVPFTFSSTTHNSDDYSDTTNKSAYNNMFFETGKRFWLASRVISADTEYACFGLRKVDSSTLAGDVRFSSFWTICLTTR